MAPCPCGVDACTLKNDAPMGTSAATERAAHAVREGLRALQGRSHSWEAARQRREELGAGTPKSVEAECELAFLSVLLHTHRQLLHGLADDAMTEEVLARARQHARAWD